MQSDFFDIIGLKKSLLEQTEMNPGTVHEYVVHLRRLGSHLHKQNIFPDQLQDDFLDEILAPWLPSTNTNNYRTTLRKYRHYQCQTRTGLVQKSSSQSASDIYQIRIRRSGVVFVFTNGGSILQTDITTLGVGIKLAHLGRQVLMGVMAVVLVAGMNIRSFADKGLLNKVKGRGTPLVRLEGIYPPFSFQGDDGKLTGFEVEST